jgi:hypothetical protein
MGQNSVKSELWSSNAELLRQHICLDCQFTDYIRFEKEQFNPIRIFKLVNEYARKILIIMVVR